MLLDSLQAIIGAANPNPGNGFAGSALFVLASTGTDIAAMPSLKNLTDINGTTILQDLAITNLTNGLQVYTNVPSYLAFLKKLFIQIPLPLYTEETFVG